MRKLIFILCLLLISGLSSYGQNSFYTIIQGGGNLGIRNPGYKGTFNGYSLHFIFGKNFNEKAFLGLGLGNETLRGDYRKSDDNDGTEKTNYQYDRNLFPIFIDGRLPLLDFGQASRMGILANAGYAAGIGPVYDKGFLGKAGLFYLYDALGKTNFTFSASYGYQQLQGNFYRSTFNHQHLNLSVGVMLK